MKKCAVFVAFLLLLALPSRQSVAEHAVPFRFTVLGYVKEKDGRVRPGVPVRVTREKTGFSYFGATDRTGLYVVVTRLADESDGEALDLRTPEQTVRILVHFNPSDHEHERGTRVDFVGATHVELPAAFADTLGRFLAE